MHTRKFSLRATGGLVGVIVLGSVLAVLVQPAAAQLVDDFNDNSIDLTLWEVSSFGGPFIIETNQRWEVTIPSNSAGEGFWVDIVGLCSLRGDFDMQVDFELLEWPFANGVRIGFGAYYGELLGQIERDSWGLDEFPNSGWPREGYYSSIGGIQWVTPANDSSGRLRLVRTTDIVTSYYWDNTASNWVVSGSAPVSEVDFDYGIGVWSHDSVFSDQEVRVAFDNFQITSGAYGGSITGVVSTASGPLPNATVEVRKGPVPVALVTTDNDGTYTVEDVPAGPTDVSVVVPLGYQAVSPPSGDAVVTVGCGTSTQDFTFEVVPNPEPCHTLHWWRLQLCRCLDYCNGPEPPICAQLLGDYPADIYAHFFESAVHPIEVEGVTYDQTSWPPLLDPDEMWTTLNPQGGPPWLDNAKAEFLSLLLNVVSGRQFTTDVMDASGGTLSQGIQQLADMLPPHDADPSNDRDALLLAQGLSNCNASLPVGTIDTGTYPDVIPFAPRPTQAVGPLRVTPNPMVKSSTIEFVVSSPGNAIVQVFDVAGRLVRTLLDEELPIGRHSAVWDARGEDGQVVASGLYFYRLTLPDRVETSKFVVMQTN